MIQYDVRSLAGLYAVTVVYMVYIAIVRYSLPMWINTDNNDNMGSIDKQELACDQRAARNSNSHKACIN